MSVHIDAPEGAIASTVLMPGDPLRARHMAERFLQEATCYNQVRGMLGYTGLYKGKRLSVQGSGMGLPSLSIYAEELIRFHGARTLLRVGTCGAMQARVRLRDIVFAQAACTDSSINRNVFGGWDFAPTADFQLLRAAYECAERRGIQPHVGNIFSSDVFYREDRTLTDRLMQHGVLAVEMETTALYTIAARSGVRALTILTVSDHLLTGEATSAVERQTSFESMMEIALDTAVAAADCMGGPAAS